MIKPIPLKDVDQYIALQPELVKPLLEKMRRTIKTAAPNAEEVISYQMPAYKYQGILVYFAACKNHIGFYPTGSGIEAFKKELTGYEGSKGAVKFPYGKPLPLGLIAKIVKFRVKLNLENAQANSNKKNLRTCVNGHQYYKSSDCPICPVCEKVHQCEGNFISLLAAPAKRALANNGITTLQQLSGFSEIELLMLHGIGQASIPTLKIALQKIGLNFKNSDVKKT